MEVPSEAIEALDRATARSKRKSSVNFPIAYVKRGDVLPTAAWLVQSHELRLKMHMTFVMQATAAPYTLPDRPTQSLARWLNLPPASGPRRANDAKKWLIERKLVTRTTLDDGKPGLLLLNPDGSGGSWNGTGASQGTERWVGLPLNFWSNYWILRLSGRSIAVLMALLELNGGSKHLDGEFMDGHRKRQYGLSDDTWTRSTQELEHHKLLRTTPVYWGDDEYERRKRNRYFVVRETLETTPDWSSDWTPRTGS
ncbi:hypothetical protein [Microbacterium oleivorans]|uniref:Uncharacterized protein n=1 Tax=Microbacterium oleivorans TaxID=273677 RepID=A0A4R5YKG6_9MICO|nr:hypothetical protein [Microbacterium oleivorans]TDL45041.1 hypothetical protein E2R54_00690 [Microbacterium oleivorans]